MSQINPFITSIIGATQIHRAGADKVRQGQDLAKNAAHASDRFEHQVESTDAAHRVGDEQPPSHFGQGGQRQGSKRPDAGPDADEQEPHIDLTA